MKSPMPSPTLVSALKSGQAVAVIGSGLTTAAGGPTWTELLRGIAAEAEATRPEEEHRITVALREIEETNHLNAASLLKEILGRQFTDAIVRQIRFKNANGKTESRRLRPRPSHHILVQLNFRAFVTTNYDTLLEDSVPLGHELPSFSRSYPHLASRIQENQRFILKLHGDIHHKEDLVLARSDYPAVQFNHELRRALGGLFQTTTPLWIGYGHNDPDLDLLLDEMQHQLGLPGGFAIAKKGDLSMEQRLRDAQIYPTFLDSYDEVEGFLERLAVASDVELQVDITIRIPWEGQRAAEDVAWKLARELSSVVEEKLEVTSVTPGSVRIALRGKAAALIELSHRIEEGDEEVIAILRNHGVAEVNSLPVGLWDAPAHPAITRHKRQPKLIVETTHNYGRFEAGPYEPGMALTLGTILRRSLLSSSGAAVTAVHIEGAPHEFSSLSGVVEDVTDIIFNLKQVPILLHGDEPKVLVIDVEGPGAVTAEQITADPSFEVVDPDVHIATLNPEVRLKLQALVKRGRGYVSADRNNDESMGIGWIPVDSSHSAVRRVNCRIAAARVGQATDYERLILEVWTNGTIHPEAAVWTAAELLQEHLAIFGVEEELRREDGVPEELVGLDALLAKAIDELDLSARSANSLKNANIHTLRDLVRRSERDLLETKNFGRKSLAEVQEMLNILGLHFGMSEMRREVIVGENLGLRPYRRN